MLRGLKTALDDRQIEDATVAEQLGMTVGNLNLKINEKIPMTVDEAKLIRDTWLPDCTLDDLLQSDGDTPTKSESLHAQAEAIGDAMRQACGNDPEVDEIEGMFHEAVSKWERAQA